jgi:hypothetical protein
MPARHREPTATTAQGFCDARPTLRRPFGAAAVALTPPLCAASAAGSTVPLLQVDGAISPASADCVTRGGRAEDPDATEDPRFERR